LTIVQAIRDISMREHLAASKRTEFEYVVACRADWSRTEFLVHLADDVSPEAVGEWRTAAAQLSLGYPAEYLTGRAQFCDLSLDIEEGVLVPRSETESLVERAADRVGEVLQSSRPLVGFEPCSGSGAISLAMADRLPTARMIGVDIDATAVRCALRSARRIGVTDRVTFMQANVLCSWNGFRRFAPAGFDFVISNPPYVTGERIQAAIESSPREPVHALYGGPDGLLFYRAIVERARRTLRPGGLLFLEIDEGLETAILKMLYASGMTNCRWFRDLQGLPRYMEARQEQ
jgi:release factor glutamine methyltransferase